MTQSEKKTVGVFTDDEGNPLSMRWMSVGCVIAALGFGIWAMGLNQADPGVNLVLIFLTAGLAPKTFQKFAEKMKS